MKLNNKGFALTSIIYMLIVLFLMILLLILANLATRKVVLDKIKNDVKENLNQGGLLAQNTYTVTFDPTIGQINQKTKQVKYNEPYGELPTPTREGYKFVGWRGKNMFTGLVKGVQINTANGEEGNNTTSAASDYIKINTDSNNYFLSGLSSDLWSYVSFYNENKEYMGRTSGTTRNNLTIQSNSISQPASPSVEGNIRYIRITQYVNGVYSTGTIDDIDNLKIQLEEGDTATSYEPYQEYTSDTIVTKQENHTLYAMWDKVYTIVYNGNGATSGTTSSSIHTYGEPQKLTPNGYEKTGYKFAGWSTSPDDTNIISDDNEYSYDNTEGSGYKNIKQYSIPAPFEEGEVYQLDVDVKGTGNLVTYFHGESGYKRVHTFNSYGTQEYVGDGHNVALLTDEWEHYRVRFTLTSTGDGNVVKYLLFRAMAGNNVQFKNIRFYKVSSTSHAYVDEQSVERLSKIPNDTVNLYAIWKANE